MPDNNLRAKLYLEADGSGLRAEVRLAGKELGALTETINQGAEATRTNTRATRTNTQATDRDTRTTRTNTQATDRDTRTTRTNTQATDRDTRATDRNTRGKDRLGRSTRKTTREKEGFFAALDAGRPRLLGYGGALVGATSALQALAAADAYINIQNRLRLVTDSQDELIGSYQALFDISQETRSALEPNVILYSRLAQASESVGTSQADLLRITATLNKQVAIGGNTAQEAAAGLVQFAQGIASGRLQGDELRSVMENLLGVSDGLIQGFAHLRREGKIDFDVTRQNIRELAAEGVLSAELLLEAVLASADATDRAFEDVAIGIGGATQQIKNSLVGLVGALEETTGAGSSLARNLSAVPSLLSGDLGEFARRLDTLGRVLGFVAAVQVGRLVGSLIALRGVQGDVARRFASMTGRSRTLSAALITQRRAVAGLHSGLRGLTALTGGPWGLAITGAVTGLSLWQSQISRTNERLEEQREILRGIPRDIEAYRAALSEAFTSDVKSQADALTGEIERLEAARAAIEKFQNADFREQLAGATGDRYAFIDRERRRQQTAVLAIPETNGSLQNLPDALLAIGEKLREVTDQSELANSVLSERRNPLPAAPGLSAGLRADIDALLPAEEDVAARYEALIERVRRENDAIQAAAKDQFGEFGPLASPQEYDAVQAGLREIVAIEAARDAAQDEAQNKRLQQTRALVAGLRSEAEQIEDTYAARVQALDLLLTEGDISDAEYQRRAARAEEERRAAEAALAQSGDRRLEQSRAIVAGLRSEEEQIEDTYAARAQALELLLAEGDISYAVFRQRAAQAEEERRAAEAVLGVEREREAQRKRQESGLPALEALIAGNRELAAVTDFSREAIERRNRASERELEIAQAFPGATEETRRALLAQYAVQDRELMIQGAIVGILERRNRETEELILRQEALNRLLATDPDALTPHQANVEQAEIDIALGEGSFSDGFIVQLDEMVEATRERMADMGASVAEVFGPGGTLQQGLADSAAAALVSGESFSEAFENTARSAVQGLVSDLIEAALHALFFKILFTKFLGENETKNKGEKEAGKKQVLQVTGKVFEAGLNAYAATAAIPIVGPALAAEAAEEAIQQASALALPAAASYLAASKGFRQGGVLEDVAFFDYRRERQIGFGGEDGIEAIFPLRRDTRGELGIQAQIPAGRGEGTTVNRTANVILQIQALDAEDVEAVLERNRFRITEAVREALADEGGVL